jgi:hypothetical protein
LAERRSVETSSGLASRQPVVIPNRRSTRWRLIQVILMSKLPKTLSAAHAEIDSLRAQLGLEPIAYDKRSRALGSANEVIESLRSQLASRPAKPAAPSSVAPSRPIEEVRAEIIKLVASNASALSALPELESIQAELNATASGFERVKLLATASKDYVTAAAKARTEKDFKREAELLRSRQRLEIRRAYELFSLPPAERKAIERQSRMPDL